MIWEAVAECATLGICCLMIMCLLCRLRAIRCINTRPCHPGRRRGTFFALFVMAWAVVTSIEVVKNVTDGWDLDFKEHPVRSTTQVVILALLFVVFIGIVFLQAKQQRADELQTFRATMRQERQARRDREQQQEPTTSRRPIGADETQALLVPLAQDYLTPPIARNQNELINCHLFHRTLERDEGIYEALSQIENQQQLQSEGNEGGQRRHSFVQALHQASSSVSSSESSLRGSYHHSVECSICLDQYFVGETICWAKTNKCNHIFHQDCIVRWLQDHDECPLCRVDILFSGVKTPQA